MCTVFDAFHSGQFIRIVFDHNAKRSAAVFSPLFD